MALALIIFMGTRRQDDKSQLLSTFCRHYHTPIEGLDIGIFLITKSSPVKR